VTCVVKITTELNVQTSEALGFCECQINVPKENSIKIQKIIISKLGTLIKSLKIIFTFI